MEKIRMWEVVSLLGIPAPPSGRSSYYVPCPCCDTIRGKKHLNINLRKEVFRCPRCGISGGIFDLYALYTGIPIDEVRKTLADQLDVQMLQLLLYLHMSLWFQSPHLRIPQVLLTKMQV